jgi:hypothetical protein
VRGAGREKEGKTVPLRSLIFLLVPRVSLQKCEGFLLTAFANVVGVGRAQRAAVPLAVHALALIPRADHATPSSWVHRKVMINRRTFPIDIEQWRENDR